MRLRSDRHESVQDDRQNGEPCAATLKILVE
jgi:hypothetical protein